MIAGADNDWRAPAAKKLPGIGGAVEVVVCSISRYGCWQTEELGAVDEGSLQFSECMLHLNEKFVLNFKSTIK